MSKTLDGIRMIQEDFRERFGVGKVVIKIYVFDVSNPDVTRETADKITGQFAGELGRVQKHHERSDTYWAAVEAVTDDGDIEVAVFYEPEVEGKLAQAGEGQRDDLVSFYPEEEEVLK